MSWNANENLKPLFSHAEPVLPVADVAETIRYWQEVLGFPSKWSWGEPPELGAVSWHTAHVQFVRTEKTKMLERHYVWIRLKNIDQLYTLHKKNEVEIVDPLTYHEYGLHQYMIQENNGHQIVFAGVLVEERHSKDFPDQVKIIERIPTKEEFLALSESTGGTAHLTNVPFENHLSAPVYGVIAVDSKTNKTIGCALVLSDKSSFYYIKDVMVHKDWQGRRVGTAIMNAISEWLDRNGVPQSMAGLYTGENLEPFYKQFGFVSAFAMVKKL